MKNKTFRKAFLTSCLAVLVISGCSASSDTPGNTKDDKKDDMSESPTQKVVEIVIDSTGESKETETETESETEPVSETSKTEETLPETDDTSTVPEESQTEEATADESSEININGYSQKQLAALYNVELSKGQGIICWSASKPAVVVTPLDGMEIFNIGDMTNNLYMCDDQIQINIYSLDDTYDLDYFKSLYEDGEMQDDKSYLLLKGEKEAELYYHDNGVTISINVTSSKEEAFKKYTQDGVYSFMKRILDSCEIVPAQ